MSSAAAGSPMAVSASIPTTTKPPSRASSPPRAASPPATPASVSSSPIRAASAAHVFAPRAAIVGGVIACVTFLTTVTLFFFLPGVFEASAGGLPAILGTGGSLLKDVVLFAASLACLIESMNAAGLAPRTRAPAFSKSS